MDRRIDVRDFLTTRRARITPDRAGLPAFGGNRRVLGLRREEVALLSGMSVDYYTRLERGDLSGVSASVLEGLARAVQLDNAETAHVHDLAHTANTSPVARKLADGQAATRCVPASNASLTRPLGIAPTKPCPTSDDALKLLATWAVTIDAVAARHEPSTKGT